MNKTPIDSTLEADKAMTEQLLSKDLLSQFDTAMKEVPAGYFEQFPETILLKIKSAEKPKAAKLFSIGRWSMAAAVLLIIASTFIFIQKSKTENQIATIAIHEIPTAEIDAYVNSNEWIAEVDIQNEINKIETNLEDGSLSKDSIN